MGLLLALASMAIASAVWNDIAKDAKASNADRRVRNSGYDLNRDFEDVLRACHVQRKSQDGVKYLSEDGWKSCVSYIQRQPYATDKDVEMFRLRYNRIRKQELKKVQDKWNRITTMLIRNIYQALNQLRQLPLRRLIISLMRNL